MQVRKKEKRKSFRNNPTSTARIESKKRKTASEPIAIQHEERVTTSESIQYGEHIFRFNPRREHQNRSSREENVPDNLERNENQDSSIRINTKERV